MAVNASDNGTVAPAPGTIPNNWYNSPYWMNGAGGSSSTRSIATGTLYFCPFFVYRRTTFLKIGLVGTGTPAGSVNMGIYRDSGRAKPIGSVISGTQSGSVTMAAALVSFTFASPVTLPAGMYWLAFSCSGTNAIAGPTGGGYEAGVARGLGATTPSAADSGQQGGWQQAFTYSTTLPAVGSPTSFNALAGGDIFFWLQAQ